MKLLHRISSRNASVLLIVLAFVTLISVVVVAFLLMARFERQASSLALNRAQAETLANYGAATAVERLREAIDDGRRFDSGSYSFWASEPGRIHVFSVNRTSGAVTHSAREMFSAVPGADADEANVDLNSASYSKLHPVTGNSPGTMKIGWMHFLADPSAPATRANPAVARVAYWVDDDSCKVNINTADGSAKGRTIAEQITDGHYSYGFGTPSEISLQAFPGITQSIATAIAQYAEFYGFNSAAEVQRAPGVPVDFYLNNKFDLTAQSSSPELTIFGEPRIYLFPSIKLGTTGEVRNTAVGAYRDGFGNGTSLGSTSHGGGDPVQDARVKEASGPIDFIYPSSKQLNETSAFTPKLAQHALDSIDTNDKAYLVRLANAIRGKDSSGDSFRWPAGSGWATDGFETKYSPRQTDSIAAQLHDLSHTTVMADQTDPATLPTILFNGLVNTDTSKPRAVIGLARNLKLTEIFIEATTSKLTLGTSADVPHLQFKATMEFLFPKTYEGVPLTKPYTDITGYRFSEDGTDGPGVYQGLNILDSRSWQTVSSAINPLPAQADLGGWWGNNMLRITDGGAGTSGIDLMGETATNFDPDQGSAGAYHPYRKHTLSGKFRGAVSVTGLTTYAPLLRFSQPIRNADAYGAFPEDSVVPGAYHSVPNSFPYVLNPGNPGVGNLQFSGGLSLWTRTGGGAGSQWEVVPLDGLRTRTYTAESAASIRNDLLRSVLPVNFPVAVPGRETYLLAVSDPLVNKFPGDWRTSVASAADSQKTLKEISGNYMGRTGESYDTKFPLGPAGPPTSDFNGDNAGFRPSDGGDPLSLWLPRQDSDYPKQSRFPSIGGLNYIRTGMIPDDLSVSLDQQKGVPWRSLNFSSNTTSQTVHGMLYPDWVLLDLFTVPFLPQRPYKLGETATPVRKLTRGGATVGKLNINNPRVPYPFGLSFPGVTQTPPERTAPLDALFYGLKTSGGSAAQAYNTDGSARTTTVDHTALRDAVQNRLAAQGPFMLPGQLAELAEINSLTYTGVAAEAQTRNDLMRQVMGAVTTQSNVYSIWVVVQTFKKSPKNTDYSRFETGDIVTGEIRRRYVVERYIETGKDGVPGNALDPGVDLVTGTADDPIDPVYNPAITLPMPYRWRYVAVDENKS